MSPKHHSNTTPAWIAQRFAKIEKLIRESNAAKKLQAATVGKGGITVKLGGFIRANYPPELGGGEAARLGPIPGGPVDGAYDATTGAGFLLSLKDENGNYVFTALRLSPSDDYPSGTSSVVAIAELVYFQTPTGSATMQFADTGIAFVSPDDVILSAATGVYITHSTTGAAANCYIDPSDGRIWRSTSSRRYKQDIADAAVDPAKVLAMRAVTFRDKGDVERNGNKAKVHVGFVAEELDELGLGVFVDYEPVWTCRDCDAHGEGHPVRRGRRLDDNVAIDEPVNPATEHATQTGHTIRRATRPDSIAYDRLSVALLAVLKDQEKRLTALEGHQP